VVLECVLERRIERGVTHSELHDLLEGRVERPGFDRGSLAGIALRICRPSTNSHKHNQDSNSLGGTNR